MLLERLQSRGCLDLLTDADLVAIRGDPVGWWQANHRRFALATARTKPS